MCSIESKNIMEQSLKMNEIREEERPYEKCLTHGAEHLTNAELLAVLLRTGSKGLYLEKCHREEKGASEQPVWHFPSHITLEKRES